MIVPRDWAWKQPIQEWAAKLGSTHVVLKRNLSDQGHHISKKSVKSFGCLSERKKFDWIVQPALKEFERYSEYRMYVINGRCRWGLATRFVKPRELEKEAVAPRREMWLFGGQDAARAAEQVVTVVSQKMQTHAARFLRVDLVKRDGGRFYVNELEFLRNAFIHFESIDNSNKLMKELVEMIVGWI